jgi:drug/metabolite transporter (DMT)-like permease
MQQRTQFLGAAALATLAVLCWSGNWVVGRGMRTDVPPFGLTFWRWSVAALVLLPIILPHLKREWSAVRRNWKVVAGLALSGGAAFQSMVYVGLQSTEATNALLLNATAPLWVILIARAVLGDRVTGRQTVGIAVSFIGAVYLVARGEPASLLRFGFNPGDGWIVAALVVWGVYSVLLKARPSDVSSHLLVFLISVGAAAAILPFHLAELARGHRMSLDASTLSAVLYTGVFASVVAFLAFNAAVARIGPSRTVYFLHLMPVFGSVMAMIFLGEALQGYHVVGFPVVLAGVLWATSERPGAATRGRRPGAVRRGGGSG